MRRIVLPLFFWLALPAWSQEVSSSNVPAYLKADALEYTHSTHMLKGTGSVVLSRDPLHLSADSLQLHQTTGQIQAEGHVQLQEPGHFLAADRAEWNLHTQLGALTHGRLFLEQENYVFEGGRIAREAPDRYALDDASFTACGCDPDWHMRAKKLRVRLGGYLTARHLTFYAGRWPVLYLPYLIYPAGMDRKSGLLVPRVGLSSRDGLRYRQEMFWALSGSEDMTFSLDYRARRGNGWGLEYRYVPSPAVSGLLQGEYFRDRIKNEENINLRYRHQQQVSERANAFMQLRYLNRSRALLALSDDIAERSQRSLVSDTGLTYRGDNGAAYLRARYTQNLSASSDEKTIQRLPEAGFYRYGRWGPLMWQSEGSAVYFWSPQGIDLPRVDIGVIARWPLRDYLMPWVGFRDTGYRHGLTRAGARHRVAIPAGIDMGLSLWKLSEEGVYHLRPQMRYQYVDVHEVSDLPQFDYIDAIDDRHAMTVSLEQQFLKKNREHGLNTPFLEPFLEQFFMRLTQTYQRDYPQTERGTSPLRAEIRWGHPLSLQMDAFYDVSHSRVRDLTTDVHLEKQDLRFALGQRYTQAGSLPKKGDLWDPSFLGRSEAVSRKVFWTGRLWLQMPWRLQGGIRLDYDADKNKMVQSLYGLWYEQDCWGMTLDYSQLPNRNEWSFMLHLKGLTPPTPERWKARF